MSDDLRLHLFEYIPELEEDEVDQVLAVLRGLLLSISSPVVRVCLEEAHDDIAHLTNRDIRVADIKDQSAAA
jgi:hypothetical protein